MENLFNQQQQQNTHTGEGNPGDTGNQGGDQGNQGQGNQQTLSLTQEQLDAIIEKRVAREQKKYSSLEQELNQLKQGQQSQQNTQTQFNNQQGNPAGGGQVSDVSAIVAEVLKNIPQLQGLAQQQQTVTQPTSSNNGISQKLARLTAKTEALALGVSPDNVEDVLTLARIDSLDLDPDGDFDATDELKIKSALEGVVKRYNIFTQQKQTKTPPVKTGAGDKDSKKQPAKRSGLGAALHEALYQNN